VLTERELIREYSWNKLLLSQRQYRSRYQQSLLLCSAAAVKTALL